MNEIFIKNQMIHFVYKLKADTASSYYSQTDSILPERLSISDFDMAKVQNKGRAKAEGKKGQLLGKFKVSEVSPLKKFKPYTCRTEIFRCIDYPLLFGYGTIGISNEEGKVTKASDTGDLIVLFTPDNGTTFDIFFFPKMGSIEFKDDALSYAHELVKKGIL